jgi:hypothetical protein
MKKIIIYSSIAIVLFFILLITYISLSIRPPFWVINHIKNGQQELAMTLAVDINDYPYPKSFPGGYYDRLLNAGMSSEKVHSIIKGFSSVYHCEGFNNNQEIYYFFGDNETNAIVWLVFYDNNKLYEERSESFPGDQTIGGYACSPGLLN